MNNQELPEIFDTFSKQRQESFLAVKEKKQNGTPIVGVYCTYFPRELVTAMGGVTVSLCATSDETIPDAEMDLPKTLCPLIKSSYGFGKTDKCPFFYFSDLVVGETTCDGKKKMFEYLATMKPVHVMELPNTQNDEALRLWKSEVVKMKEKLEEIFAVEITEENLREAITLENEYRTAVKGLCEVMKYKEPPMSGKELFSLLHGSDFRFDRKNLIEEIKDVTARLHKAHEDGEKKHSGARILVTGCPIGGVFNKVIDAIEDNGGVVVAYENCNGIKNFQGLVDETSDDVYEALASRYLSIGCSVMTPNKNRMESIRNIIDEYEVDGVVEIVLQTCLTYSVESGLVKEVVKGKDRPFMSVTTDYGTADEGQLKTRMTAFLEML